MLQINSGNLKKWSEIGSRGAFGEAIMYLGETRPDVIVVTADLSDATRVTKFAGTYPHRFINVGIAEQNMIGLAAGLALSGKTVFATTFAAFAAMRCCEQVRTDLGYQNANVKLIGADGGVVMGTLGNTHYAVEDIAIIRAMPYMTVLSPADGLEIIKATLASVLYKGPVYIRLTGAKNNPIVYDCDYDYEIGKAITLEEGSDVAIIATGTMVAAALEASNILKLKGISSRIIDMHTIKPLDEITVKKAAKETGLVIAVEEHSKIGGLGSAVADVMAAMGNVPKLINIALPDALGPIGTYPEQLERYGLTPSNIVETVLNNL